MADTQSIHAIGRRKEAVCRVFIKPGSGKWDVNGRTLGDYFPRPVLVSQIQQAFVATDTLGRFDVRPDGDSTVPINLRMHLQAEGQALTETWLYQWTPPPVAQRILY